MMNKIVVIAFGLILFCASVFVKVICGSKRRYTAKTTGTITDYHITEDPDLTKFPRGWAYYPIITFESQLGTKRIQLNCYSVGCHKPVGTSVTVRYNPDNPSDIYCPSLEGWANMMPWILMLLGIASILAGIFYA